MYRSCIFCSTGLGANEAIERFPVGRSLAFDAAKGRLWAVCPKCARWNLAPIEERWEAIEEAERLFRDTRLRAQSENVGLAKLRDGTRLIRVGQALPGELAVWRYGETLMRRRRRYLAAAGPLGVLGGAGWLALVPGAGVVGLAGICGAVGCEVVRWMWDASRAVRPVIRLSPGEAAIPGPITVFPEHMLGARMVETEDGRIGVLVPDLRHRDEWSHIRGTPPIPVVVVGDPARRLLNRVMVIANQRGAQRDGVLQAVERIAAAGAPEEYLLNAARGRRMLLAEEDEGRPSLLAELFETTPVSDLALEMALHEETERRALEGELAMLEAMWREAEEIAAIADRLPELPAPDPPKLTAG